MAGEQKAAGLLKRLLMALRGPAAAGAGGAAAAEGAGALGAAGEAAGALGAEGAAAGGAAAAGGEGLLASLGLTGGLWPLFAMYLLYQGVNLGTDALINDPRKLRMMKQQLQLQAGEATKNREVTKQLAREEMAQRALQQKAQLTLAGGQAKAGAIAQKGAQDLAIETQFENKRPYGEILGSPTLGLDLG